MDKNLRSPGDLILTHTHLSLRREIHGLTQPVSSQGTSRVEGRARPDYRPTALQARGILGGSQGLPAPLPAQASGEAPWSPLSTPKKRWHSKQDVHKVLQRCPQEELQGALKHVDPVKKPLLPAWGEGSPTKAKESPTKRRHPLLINQSFLNPGLPPPSNPQREGHASG